MVKNLLWYIYRRNTSPYLRLVFAHSIMKRRCNVVCILCPSQEKNGLYSQQCIIRLNELDVLNLQILMLQNDIVKSCSKLVKVTTVHHLPSALTDVGAQLLSAESSVLLVASIVLHCARGRYYSPFFR